jgi:DNA-binding MarR family transcriptional regulator
MEPTAGSGLLTDVGFLLTRASGLFVRACNVALAPCGLRVRPYSVLLMACSAPGGVSQRDLAAALGLDPSQVVSLVDDLAASGLVERRPAESDRRTKLVVATDAGRAVRDEAVVRVDTAATAQLAGFSGTERLILRDLLTRLVAGSAGPP